MKTIQTESINYKKLKCPHCQITGHYNKDKQENIYCTECGLVIESPYPYVAGIRFKTLSNTKQKRRQRKKWKQTTSVQSQHFSQ